MKKRISIVLCLTMILAMCFGMVACGKKAPTEPTTVSMVSGQTYGSGNTSFAFSVTDPDGKETAVTVKTDKDTVGAAQRVRPVRHHGQRHNFGLREGRQVLGLLHQRRVCHDRRGCYPRRRRRFLLLRSGIIFSKQKGPVSNLLLGSGCNRHPRKESFGTGPFLIRRTSLSNEFAEFNLSKGVFVTVVHVNYKNIA